MPPRLFPLLVIVFWMIMTGLLIQTEMRPAKSRLRAVRTEHVLKLIFLHEQASDLYIYNDRTRLGYLRLHPRTDKETGAKFVEFSGNLHLRIPTLERQRFSWEGTVEMDSACHMQRVSFHVIMHEPANYRLEAAIDGLSRRVRLTQHLGGRTTDQTFPLDESGAAQLMRSLQVDPALVKTLRGGNTVTPTVTAEQSSLLIHGERVETYLVTIERGGQTLLEFHVDQLGQIASAKTLIGYTLAPHDSIP